MHVRKGEGVGKSKSLAHDSCTILACCHVVFFTRLNLFFIFMRSFSFIKGGVYYR